MPLGFYTSYNKVTLKLSVTTINGTDFASQNYITPPTQSGPLSSLHTTNTDATNGHSPPTTAQLNDLNS